MENNVSFVLLAGGKSSRMGVAKGLLKYNQTFWILEQLQRIQNSNIQNVYIGLGFDTKAYFTAIPWLEDAIDEQVKYGDLSVKVVLNEHPERGSFSTLQTVLEKVTPKSAVIISPIDVPLCNSDELNTIVKEKAKVVLPAYNGKHGHPIKISHSLWSKFIDIDTKSEYARLDYQIKSIDNQSIKTIPVDDENIIMNLNNVEAWKRFIGK